ncbi:ribonuclease H-like domain-containing protein [Aurantibacter crassamenti]|uniref:exonuclease domain-containing protein n=1 Tax=Aurantibacter crassamenti TaxID=1837375 RepID=UPI00193A97FF|nr:exonuclease domain-containing protein [Aurantibacter crassamenti]MBM1107486.1 ribonuclease H-like domain-containing protein [Aurantibacter crassamenti]
MYTVLDIETTGGKYNEEGITEIAIHKFDGHEVVDKFISLVNPEKEIQPFVVKLTGINNNMLHSAPKFHEVAKRIVEITEGTVLVAHNAQFDYRILRTEFRRLGYDFERQTICTVDLSKKLLPDAESHSLGKLVRSLGIAVSDRHRANGDALATLKLFKLLLAKDSEKAIIKTVLREASTGELSDRLLDIVETLPIATGVFYMHNKDSEIIYLSKSSNIKKRVNQQFIKPGSRARKLQKETRKVTFEKTGSDLIAQLKEYEELKRIRPRYNQAKGKLFNYGLYSEKDSKGLIKLKVVPLIKGEKAIITFNGAESGASFLQKISNEICADKSDIVTYNAEIEKLLLKYRIVKRTLIIKDKGREIGEQSVIYIKNGIYKGYGYCELNHQINNIHILESIITPAKGDANTNHFITTHLRKKGSHLIEEINP